VPEAQTDFILPIIGEELGFAGVVLVVGLMGLVVVRGISIAWGARDDFGRYLAFGITLLIGVQAVINMGVATALLPTKGLTLPFISFGGTSLILTCFSVGLLLSVSRWNQIEPPPPQDAKKPRSKVITRKRPVVQRERPVTEVLT
jgi:cell division protein FtsW